MDTSDLGQVDELKFNSHISNICKKASMKLNVVKGLGKYLNRIGKLTIYHSFILANLNCLPTIMALLQ
jgi:hypothetical protein